MKFLLICPFLMLSALLFAQDVSQQLQKPAQVPEAEKRAGWQKMGKAAAFSFVNSNMRYSGDVVPEVRIKQTDTLAAWKGEKVHAQMLIWTNSDITDVNIQASDLTGANSKKISAKNITPGFITYVITDEFGNGCGSRLPGDFDSFLVADPINTAAKSVSLAKQTVQPVWISVEVPQNIAAGYYTGTISLHAGKQEQVAKLVVRVLDRTLPPPAEWKFNLDLWQHPAAIARVENVPLWSDRHFEAMRPYYTMLAKAGQKNITASIVDEPWNHQTYDDYPSLVKWTKKKDGTWDYDYSLFDKYVSFVMDCGINTRINCYSMVPWKIAFPYSDEAQNKQVLFTSAVGTPEYNEFWKNMLTDFTRHLKDKGWFDITAIAMDERPMEAMQSVIRLLKEVDKNWKIALAGDYHPEIEKEIYDYCVASRWKFDSAVLQDRHQQNKLSTWYTCCVEKYPNGFTFSPPAEHVWIGWYTAAHNMDGYLRWAYNSWTAEPLKDSRFRTWPAGDTYQVYPGAQTSIRFEKLIEGIQDFEKIRILKQEYKANKQEDKLENLRKVLAGFEIGALQNVSAEEMVRKAKREIN